MTSELKTALPDRVCIWDADKSDPTSTRGWTISFQENHPDIYVRASAVTRAVPDVPELVRYSAVRRYGREEIIEKDEHGEYVLHSQAAKILAAKDAEIYFDASLRITYKSLCETLNEECGKRFKRAEAAEAKNIELEAAWLNAEGKISDLEAKLDQIEKQEPVGYITGRSLPLNENGAYIMKEPCTDWPEKYKGCISLYTAPVASDADLRAENERLRVRLNAAADDFDLIQQRIEDVQTERASATAWQGAKEARAALNPSEPKS